MHSHREEHIEDLLERVWCAREDGRSLGLDAPELQRGGVPADSVSELVARGYARLVDGRLTLTDSGDTGARTVVRRHRLAEELLSEVLEVKGRDMFFAACSFEHVLTPLVTDRICTLLGHPTVCPHGRSIPPGVCCSRMDTSIKPFVSRLTELPIGSEARIVFMAPGQQRKMERLMALGVLPGTIIKLQQKRPAFVVRVGETTIAVDEDILAEVYVRSYAGGSPDPEAG